MRTYGADEIYTLFLLQRSLEMWTAFLAEENRSDCFRRTGVLWLANRSEVSIHTARAIFERHKVAHEFLEPGGVRELCPEMDVPARSVALFEPDCGALLAEESVRAVVKAAIRGGTRYVNERVESLRSLKIEADVFVFACGSWLPKLFPEELGAAIFSTRQEVFFFEPWTAVSSPSLPSPSLPSPSLPIWVDQTDPRVPYGFPDIEGEGIKVAFHRTGSAIRS